MPKTFFVGSLIAVGVVVSVAACGSSGATPDVLGAPDSGKGSDTSTLAQPKGKASGPDAGVELDPALLPIAQWNKEIAQAICGKLTECCDTNDYRGYFQRYRRSPYDFSVQKGTERVPAPAPKTAAECESVVARQLGLLNLEKWGVTVAAKRMSFDAPRAAACTAAVKGVACGTDTVKVLYDNACFGSRYNEVLKKVSPVGSVCETGDGTYYGTCDITLGRCGYQDHLCKPWAHEGESCSLSAFCAPDLDCAIGDISKPGVCKSPVVRALGEDCTKAADGDAPVACGDSFYCRDDGTRRTCARKAEDGAACTDDSDCLTERFLSCSPLTRTCGYTFCGGRKPVTQ